MKRIFLSLSIAIFVLAPLHTVHAVPFGGLIVGRIECTCTGNYLIVVNEAKGQKNLLIQPPISRIYQYYLFNIGQYALGTYTPGPKCLIRNGNSEKCDEVPTDGIIDSMPGAGSSGPLRPTSPVKSPLLDALSGVASSLKGALNSLVSGNNNKNNQSLNAGAEHAQSGEKTKQLSRITVKNYFIPSEREFTGTSTTPIFDTNGTLIAEANTTFVMDREEGTLFTEGAGILRDGTVLVYDQTINGTKRYTVVTSGVGIGKTGIALSPFRSIAVDTSVIPLGSLVEIPKTKNITLPDGTKHNGIWRADDVLDATAVEDVSLFIGVSANRTYLQNVGIRNQQQMSMSVFE